MFHHAHGGAARILDKEVMPLPRLRRKRAFGHGAVGLDKLMLAEGGKTALVSLFIERRQQHAAGLGVEAVQKARFPVVGAQAGKQRVLPHTVLIDVHGQALRL